jgi:hypothetical protein
MTDKPSAEALDAARKYLGAQPNIVVLALAEVVPALAAALDAFAAEREAEAVARERAWQPIETAPKDGTRFLAYELGQAEYRVYECWWQDDFSNWSGWQNDWDSEPEPTHWRTLPSPPEQQS